jgi:hypothetical protein
MEMAHRIGGSHADNFGLGLEPLQFDYMPKGNRTEKKSRDAII